MALVFLDEVQARSPYRLGCRARGHCVAGEGGGVWYLSSSLATIPLHAAAARHLEAAVRRPVSTCALGGSSGPGDSFLQVRGGEGSYHRMGWKILRSGM